MASSWSKPHLVWDGDYSQPSLAVDGHGHAHVAARGDTGIWYLTNTSGQWKRTRLTRDHVEDGFPVTASNPAIAIDASSGRLVVAYMSTKNYGGAPCCASDIQYRTHTAAGWSGVQSGPAGVGAFALAAARGDIAIAMLGWQPPGAGTPRMLFASRSGGWASHRIAGGGENNGTIGLPSLALDSHDRPYVAYSRNGSLKIAHGTTKTGDAFTFERVADLGGDDSPSLVLSANDRPQIVAPTVDGTRYFALNRTGWHDRGTVPGDFEARLALGAGGARIVSINGAGHGVFESERRSGGWLTRHLDATSSVVALGGIGASGGVTEFIYQRGSAQPRLWSISST